MLELGIDDAGRGPVIGPMVLAGCLIGSEKLPELKKLEVKDSKQITQKRREFLAEKIKGLAESFETEVVYPENIDGDQEKGINLNDVEAIACAKIINKLNNKQKIKVVIDCPSTSINKWKDFLKTKIDDLSNLEIVCEHKADKNHLCVSAASILAKCKREEEMKKLKEKYGEGIGSGYTSDPLTRRFLEKFAHKHKNDGIFRKSWITWKNASGNLEQRKLV